MHTPPDKKNAALSSYSACFIAWVLTWSQLTHTTSCLLSNMLHHLPQPITMGSVLDHSCIFHFLTPIRSFLLLPFFSSSQHCSYWCIKETHRQAKITHNSVCSTQPCVFNPKCQCASFLRLAEGGKEPQPVPCFLSVICPPSLWLSCSPHSPALCVCHVEL